MCIPLCGSLIRRNRDGTLVVGTDDGMLIGLCCSQCSVYSAQPTTIVHGTTVDVSLRDVLLGRANGGVCRLTGMYNNAISYLLPSISATTSSVQCLIGESIVKGRYQVTVQITTGGGWVENNYVEATSSVCSNPTGADIYETAAVSDIQQV